MKKTGVILACCLILAALSSCEYHIMQPDASEANSSVTVPVEPLSQEEMGKQKEVTVEPERSGTGIMEEHTSISLQEASRLEEEAPSIPDALAGQHWWEAYADYLHEANFIEFYIGDINRDGIPEAVIRYNDLTNSGAILCFKDNSLQVLELRVVSAWGEVGYLEDTNQIIFLEWYGHTQGTFGSVDFYLYEWTPEGYSQTISVIRESGYDPNIDGNGVYGQGYINGEKVEFDEFEIALAEMYALLERSTWFPMTNAAEVENYLDYLMQWAQMSSPK